MTEFFMTNITGENVATRELKPPETVFIVFADAMWAVGHDVTCELIL